MLRRAILASFLAAVAALVAVSSARGDGGVFFVTGKLDNGGACVAYPGLPAGFYACDSLRVAVATAAPGDAVVLRDPGTYQLTQGALSLPTDITIIGQNARTTTIQALGPDRVIRVFEDATVSITNVTLLGGFAGGQDGGNILNTGSLTLGFVRVTRGQGFNGGGIANEGSLTLAYSLVDGNTAQGIDGGAGRGGGIVNRGSLTVNDSTIFNNEAVSAGGVDSPDAVSLTLSHVTLAFNRASGQPGGLSASGNWTAHGSLFIGNTGDGVATNCDTAAAQGSAANIEDATGCGFGTPVGNTALSNTLSDQGGPTDVLTIPAGSPAKRFDPQCVSGADQRLAPRNLSGGCDAGAFEQGATAPPVAGFPVPPVTTPPPPPPTPSATPTPTPTPTPVAGKTVVVKTVKGTVKFRLPGTNRFVELDGTQGIPVGATVDTKKGTVQLTSQQKKGGKSQTAKFFDGIFKLGQTKTTTDLTLTEKLAACPKRGAKKAGAAAKRKPKTRRLWGDGRGAFRTRGRYSAATVRGTKWLVQDSCAGTLTRVTQGAVNVRDSVRRKTIVVRAGHRYRAKPRR